MFIIPKHTCETFRLFGLCSWRKEDICNGSVTFTIESSTNGTATLSRMNLSGYVGRVTIFSWMFTTACCLVVGLGLRFGLGLGLDLMSGWLVVMHTYLYCYRLSLSHCTMRWRAGTLHAASMVLHRAPAEGSQWNTWATNWSWAQCMMNPHKLRATNSTRTTGQQKRQKITHCQTPSKRQEDKETCLLVRLSLCPLCLSGASIIYGERSATLHRHSRETVKNPRSTNKDTKFGQLIFRKIIKIIATRCHILGWNSPNSILVSVRLSLR